MHVFKKLYKRHIIKIILKKQTTIQKVYNINLIMLSKYFYFQLYTAEYFYYIQYPSNLLNLLLQSGEMLLKMGNEGHLGGSAVEHLPLVQGMILGLWDGVPHQAPHRESASPSACLCLSLSVSLSLKHTVNIVLRWWGSSN